MSTVFVDRQSTYPNRCRITPLDGTPYYAVVERADEPIVVGTPLNAETLNGMVSEITAKFHAESAEYTGCYYRMVDGNVEWINPPMIPGVEYRTTERMEGKPVYIKRMDVDLPVVNQSCSAEIVRGGEQLRILDISGVVTDAANTTVFPLPFIGFGGTVCAVAWVKIVVPTQGLTIMQLDCKVLEANLNYGSGTFYIKYTK